jgi:uncharacterized protein YegP (UPF0339 family)
MRRFEAYEDENGNWRWRLWSNNGKIVASSGEAFSSQAGALQAAERVRAAAGGAEMSIAPGLGIRAALRLRALLGDGERPPAQTSGARRTRLRVVRPLTTAAGAPRSISIGTGS